MSAFSTETVSTDSCPAKPTLSRTMSMVQPEDLTPLELRVPIPSRPLLSRTMSVVQSEELTPLEDSAFSRPMLSRTMSVVQPQEENEFPVAPALRRTYAVGFDMYDDSPSNVPLSDSDEVDKGPCEACTAITSRIGGPIEGFDTCSSCGYKWWPYQ